MSGPGERPPGQVSATALVLDGPRRLSAVELPLPPVDGGALLRVEACGLCGTDHEQWSGALPMPTPFVPGHESVGIIEDIDHDLSRRWNLGVGDRVAVEVFQACGECDECRAGATQRCGKHGLRDAFGFSPVGRPPGLWGGYATHQILPADSRVLRVPPSLDPVVATLFNPVGAGIRWGVTVPGTADGDVVAVLGPGIRGLSVAAAAKEAGAGFVMVTGWGARDAERLGLAPSFGADLTVDTEADDPAAALTAATGTLADVVVDVTANSPAAFTQALDLARAGGTVVVAGTRGFAEVPGFRPDLVVYRELRVLGALGVDTASYVAALDLLASGRYPFAELPRRCAGPEGIGALLGSMAGESGEAAPVHGVFVP